MKNNNTPKAPIFLKTALDILFILLMIGVVFFTLIGLYFLISGETIPIRINNIEISEFNTATAIAIVLSLVSNLLFLIVIWNFRKLVRLFFKRKLFTVEQTSIMTRIGKLSIIVAFLDPLISAVFNLLSEDYERINISLRFGGEGFGSFWFILALGLFFLYLGKIFDNARLLKEENELTV